MAVAYLLSSKTCFKKTTNFYLPCIGTTTFSTWLHFNCGKFIISVLFDLWVDFGFFHLIPPNPLDSNQSQEKINWFHTFELLIKIPKKFDNIIIYTKSENIMFKSSKTWNEDNVFVLSEKQFCVVICLTCFLDQWTLPSMYLSCFQLIAD